MSAQAENLEKLLKGNNVGTIKMTLDRVRSSVVEELKKKYKANSTSELAMKLS